MLTTLFFLAATTLDTMPTAGSVTSADSTAESVRAIAVSEQQPRRRAVEYSDWYHRRLTIHRWGSYAMVPLFAAQYYLGNKLYTGKGVTSSTRDMHSTVATGIGVLFTTNTVTGLWNLWDSRRDSQGRTKRLVHAGMMIAADAGFLYTASRVDDDGTNTLDQRRSHRTAALASVSLSTASAAFMFFTKK